MSDPGGIAVAAAATGTSASLWPAVIAATTAIVVLIANLTFNLVNDRLKHKKEIQLASIAAETKFQDSRREALRVAVAAFASSSVRQVELASSLMKNPAQPPARDALIDAHSDLRSQYEGLLLLSNSTALQGAAREVLRVAWNERQEGLGLERKRPRPEGVAPAKHLRTTLRSLHQEARRELGLSPDLHEEPDD